MATAENEEALPRCRVLIRSKEGVELYDVPERPTDSIPESTSRPFLCKASTSLPMLSTPTGSHVYVHVNNHGIVKLPLDGGDAVFNPGKLPPAFFPNTERVQMMELSPLGNYMVTWERWNADERPNNLRLWETKGGRLRANFAQKNLRRAAWPYLRFTPNEQFGVLHDTQHNQVRVYPAAQFAVSADEEEGTLPGIRYSDHLHLKDLDSVSLPTNYSNDPLQPPNRYCFTTFVPATKDKPARAALYEFRPVPGSTNNNDKNMHLIHSKSLFQAEDMKVHWSPAGDAALITLQTSVDSSGQSYYGSSQLFLLRRQSKEVVPVPLPQDGPVLDVQWLPDASKPPCFVVVAGKMPSMSSLHHGQTGQATFLFGNAHRNSVSWAPHGRFLCLAGFGNLAGGMGFWDRNKQKLTVGGTQLVQQNGLRAKAAVVGYEWSPNSRVFLCSTCTPRMNVDNGLQLFRYNGDELTNVPWNNARDYQPDKLLQAMFVPACTATSETGPLKNNYPDRPQTPPPEGAVTAAAAAAPAPKAPASAGKYVPPSARNRAGRGGGGGSLAERLRREKEGQTQGATRITANSRAAVVGTGVVGLAPEKKSKSAIKREKDKKRKEAAAAAAAAAAEEEARLAAAAAEAAAKAPAPAVDPEKRARKLKKTLKQIGDLKQKDASTLNDDQKAKLASEPEILAELKALGL